MPRIKLTIAYDGTDFRGWAISPGHRTVQAVLADSIVAATGQGLEITGASRTDSGAHAAGQVCHFDSEVAIPTEKWPRILNRVLAADVAIVSAEPVADDFNCRFCAEDRFYVYTVRTGRRDPLRSRYVHDYNRPLNTAAMAEAAKSLIGEHDFRAFTEELDPSIDNTKRKMRRVDVVESGDEVRIEVVGTAFLRWMMRRMSGALLEVGRGSRPVEEVAKLLTDDRNHLQWPVVLQAKGLCLMHVRYANPPRDCRPDKRIPLPSQGEA